MAVISLSEIAINTTVKIKLDGVLEDFIVKQVGIPSTAPEGMYDTSCDGVWVESQWLWPDSMKFAPSETGYHYGTSNVHKFLNDAETGYLSHFDPEFLEKLPPVKIPYNTSTYYTGGQSDTKTGADGLEVRAFIQAQTEVSGSWEWQNVGIGVCLAGNKKYNYPYADGDYDKFTKANPSKRRTYWCREPQYNSSVSSTRNYQAVMYAGWTQNNYTSIMFSQATVSYYIAPTMILPKTWYYDTDTGEVIYTAPPTAPGSIDVTGVVIGEQAAITLTAATDEDGTVESYIYERSVDGSSDWQQIANVNSLTQQDTVSEDWGTVAYRACAVDNMGVSGPYVTSETYDVNAGWVIISGPNENLGDKPVTFDFNFTLSVSGESNIETIDYIIELDGKQIKSGSVNENEQVSVQIETRTLGSGSHVITVSASKDLYVPSVKTFTFNIPTAVLPEAGKSGVFYGPDGNPLYPLTLAQQVIGSDGKDLGSIISGLLSQSVVQMEYGTYVGTGTYGESNPNSLTFDFDPVCVIAGRSALLGSSLNTQGCIIALKGTTVSAFSVSSCIIDGNTITWYSTSNADRQINGSGVTYGYIALGLKEGTK